MAMMKRERPIVALLAAVLCPALLATAPLHAQGGSQGESEGGEARPENAAMVCLEAARTIGGSYEQELERIAQREIAAGKEGSDLDRNALKDEARRSAVMMHQEEVRRVMDAAEAGAFDLGIQYDQLGENIQVMEIQNDCLLVRSVGEMLASDARRLLERGEGAAAAERAETIFRIGSLMIANGGVRYEWEQGVVFFIMGRRLVEDLMEWNILIEPERERLAEVVREARRTLREHTPRILESDLAIQRQLRPTGSLSAEELAGPLAESQEIGRRMLTLFDAHGMQHRINELAESAQTSIATNLLKHRIARKYRTYHRRMNDLRQTIEILEG